MAAKLSVVGKTERNLDTVFPFLEFEEKDDTEEVMLALKQEYNFSEYDGANTLTRGGEDFNLELRTDHNELGHRVFKAVLVTYCPLNEHGSEYNLCPHAALAELAGLLKPATRARRK
jgi:hypothetical protein